MKIIPAIDIIEGKCVRLTQGDYAQKTVYNENPVDVAIRFEQAGLKYLHLVDLDGAKAGKVINWDTVKAVTSKTNLIVDFGGGIKTESEIQKLLDLGVAQVNLGSVAVKQPQLVQQWLKKFRSEKIILSADVKDEIVQISGWQEKTSLTIHDFVTDYQGHGIQFVTCTDISTDGMLTGPNIGLYKKLVSLFPSIKWIASGGVSSMDDIHELKDNGLSGVIIGKAIYENKINLGDLKLISIRK
jgi:phosphoribosylformimino-5-aminoimidazole carboxamide ribotide isomerase